MSEQSQDSLRLFIIIFDQPQLLDDLLTGFLDLGIPGATVIESRGMGQIIREDMPVFAGLANLFGESTGSRMIYSVMNLEQVESVMALVEEIVGSVEAKNSAVCITLPVDQFKSIRH